MHTRKLIQFLETHLNLFQLAVLIVTCGVVAWYTVETWRIREVMRSQLEQSSQQTNLFLEQIESMSRPAIVHLGTFLPEVNASRFLPVFKFVNAGSGPAIHVQVRVHIASKDVHQSGSKDYYPSALVESGKEIAVDPDEFFSSMHSHSTGILGNPDNYRVMTVVYYESLSHRKYCSVRYFGPQPQINERIGYEKDISPFVGKWGSELDAFAGR
jgi:hypothetical protein